MNALRFGAVTLIKATNPPKYPSDWLHMLNNSGRTPLKAVTPDQLTAKVEFDTYVVAKDAFHTKVDTHIATLQAQHHGEPDYPVFALGYGPHFMESLVLDGDDLKQFLLDKQLKKQQYTRFYAEQNIAAWQSGKDFDESLAVRSASPQAPALNQGKELFAMFKAAPLSGIEMGLARYEQMAEGDVLREYFQKATPLDVTV